jgi:hypothetical protein
MPYFDEKEDQYSNMLHYHSILCTPLALLQNLYILQTKIPIEQVHKSQKINWDLAIGIWDFAIPHPAEERPMSKLIGLFAYSAR